MPITQPRQFRLSAEDLAAIDEFGKEWGPVQPLTRTEVLRELIRRERARARRRAGRKGGGKAALLALACLACLAGPADAGTITYTYRNTEYYDPGVGRLVVDEAALFRGEILPGDIRSFSFLGGLYRAQDLDPVDVAIDPQTGWGFAVLEANRQIAPGVYYHLDLTLREGTGSWTSHIRGAHDVYGYGTWSVKLEIAPEPSSLVLGFAGLACVGVGRLCWTRGERAV